MFKKLLASLFASILFLSTPTALATESYFIHAPRIHVKDGTSTNWSGYASLTNLSNPQLGSVSDVKGTWTVPSVTCATGETSYSSNWVGIDGYSNGTVEQTGTESDCNNGTSRYYAWYEMYPKFGYIIPVTVAAGNTVSAEVQYLNGKFILTLTNITTGKSFFTAQKAPNAKRQSAEWIVEAPSSSGRVLPLANFGTTNLSSASATINGHTGTISDGSWQNDAITMVASDGLTVKAQPSALSPDGSGFSVAWKHN